MSAIRHQLSSESQILKWNMNNTIWYRLLVFHHNSHRQGVGIYIFLAFHKNVNCNLRWQLETWICMQNWELGLEDKYKSVYLFLQRSAEKEIYERKLKDQIMLPGISPLCEDNTKPKIMLSTGSSVLKNHMLKSICNWTNLLCAVSVKECKTPAFSSWRQQYPLGSELKYICQPAPL